MLSGHTCTVRSRILATLVAGGLSAAVLSPAVSTQAAPTGPKYVSCSWQVGARDRTMVCGPEFATKGKVQFSQCWRYRPVQAVVQRKVGRQWLSTPLRVRAFENATSCDAKTPWRSLVEVSTRANNPGVTTNYQLVVPASDRYRRTVVAFAVCTVKVGTTTPCS